MTELVFESIHGTLPAHRDLTITLPPAYTYILTTTNNVDKANAFNTYFASKSTLTDVPRALPPLYYRTIERIEYVETSPEEIENLISNLDATKAHGPDEISICLLKAPECPSVRV